MRTTLTLDDDVAAQLREEAERQGVPFRQVVNRAIRLGLRAAGERQPGVPFRVRPHSFGLKPGIDQTKLGQLADELETEAFRARYQQLSGAPVGRLAAHGHRPLA
jgi:hypothetical protein